jgi:arylsulfatase A-like enzyme
MAMNVILFNTDSYRRDNLSCYGPTRVKTPSLDKFAKQAHVFENANTGSFATLNNRMDIMSGRFSFIDHQWGRLPQDWVTLQQLLTASGVRTHAIYDNPHLSEMGYNYERGFGSWDWTRGQETDLWRTEPRNLEMPPRPETYCRREFIIRGYLSNNQKCKNEEDFFPARTITSACKWLEDNQDQDKFFLYLDLFDPHEPWDPPKKYLDWYDPNYSGFRLAFPDYRFWREYFSEEEMQNFRNLYYAEASMVDHWFGVLMDKLDELGISEDTAVIFTSDHGYLFGEHEFIGKSLMVDEGGRPGNESVPLYSDIRRIPLMVRLPGQGKGTRIPALVQPADLMPTILEMCGLVTSEVVAGQAQIQALQCGIFVTEDWKFDPASVHGRTLMPLLNGATSRYRDITITSGTLLQHTSLLSKCAIVT